VTAVRDVGVELRHVSEQLVPFHDIGVPIQYPEGGERPGTFFQFLHVTSLRLLPLPKPEADREMSAPSEARRRHLLQILPNPDGPLPGRRRQGPVPDHSAATPSADEMVSVAAGGSCASATLTPSP